MATLVSCQDEKQRRKEREREGYGARVLCM